MSATTRTLLCLGVLAASALAFPGCRGCRKDGPDPAAAAVATPPATTGSLPPSLGTGSGRENSPTVAPENAEAIREEYGLEIDQVRRLRALTATLGRPRLSQDGKTAKLPAFSVAVIEKTGKAKLQEAVSEVAAELRRQKIFTRAMPVALYPADAKEKGDAGTWSVGFPVAPEAQVTAPLKRVEVAATDVVFVSRRTDADSAPGKLGADLDKLVSEVGRSAHAPMILRLPNHGVAEDPEKVSVELMVPVSP